MTLSQPTDQSEEISKVALDLMRTVRRSGQAVRLIGVGVSGLDRPSVNYLCGFWIREVTPFAGSNGRAQGKVWRQGNSSR